jgi:hypothetical protein
MHGGFWNSDPATHDSPKALGEGTASFPPRGKVVINDAPQNY